MPGEPFVCCICLTKDRPQYLPRAIACYEAQTYPHKALFVLDASTPEYRNRTIGWLRNQANKSAHGPDMLIAHFDDDDWSAPTRLAEQVTFIEATGVPIVGYSDMPFYDEVRDKVLLYDSRNTYYALGTSLMYRRDFWEAHPFPDQNDEDTTWQNALEQTVGIAKCVRSTSSLGCPDCHSGKHNTLPFCPGCGLPYNPLRPVPVISPRMFATIHRGNTSAKQGARFQAASAELDRAVRNLLNISSGQASRATEGTSVLS